MYSVGYLLLAIWAACASSCFCWKETFYFTRMNLVKKPVNYKLLENQQAESLIRCSSICVLTPECDAFTFTVNDGQDENQQKISCVLMTVSTETEVIIQNPPPMLTYVKDRARVKKGITTTETVTTPSTTLTAEHVATTSSKTVTEEEITTITTQSTTASTSVSTTISPLPCRPEAAIGFKNQYFVVISDENQVFVLNDVTPYAQATNAKGGKVSDIFSDIGTKQILSAHAGSCTDSFVFITSDYTWYSYQLSINANNQLVATTSSDSSLMRKLNSTNIRMSEILSSTYLIFETTSGGACYENSDMYCHPKCDASKGSDKKKSPNPPGPEAAGASCTTVANTLAGSPYAEVKAIAAKGADLYLFYSNAIEIFSQ